jgi:Caspase domain
MAKSTLTENRYAVCIGINTYELGAGLGSLRHAEDDARAMDNLLACLSFPDGNRKRLLGKAATLDAINTALEEFVLDRPQVNDLVLFYFAGHSKPLKFSDSSDAGDDGAKGEVFLTSYDFDANKIRQSRAFRSQRALGMNRLRGTFFEGEGSRKRLFIFDSCYSGDFFGPRYRDEADPVQGYIGRMLDSRSNGRLALSSCLPYQKARDADTTTPGHSPFTYYLLKALSGEDPDALDRHDCLAVSDLFKYIERNLPEDQCPVLSGVQQGSFELICYPQHAQMTEPEPGREETQQDRRAEKDARLRAMFADHRSFMQGRWRASSVVRWNWWRYGCAFGRKCQLAATSP